MSQPNHWPVTPDDHDSLIEMVGDARFVLPGEASHDTHEFYRERALITKRSSINGLQSRRAQMLAGICHRLFSLA